MSYVVIGITIVSNLFFSTHFTISFNFLLLFWLNNFTVNGPNSIKSKNTQFKPPFVVRHYKFVRRNLWQIDRLTDREIANSFTFVCCAALSYFLKKIKLMYFFHIKHEIATSKIVHQTSQKKFWCWCWCYITYDVCDVWCTEHWF